MANLTKDQRLIKDNPNATPHELLLKGLSQAKYAELVEAAENVVKAPIYKDYKQPANIEEIKAENAKNMQVQPKVETVMNKQAPVIRAIPKTDAAAPIFQGSHDMAWLIDKTGKCRPMRLTMTQALRQVRKYPKQFEIK